MVVVITHASSPKNIISAYKAVMTAYQLIKIFAIYWYAVFEVIYLKDEFKGRYKKLGLKIAYYRKLKDYTQETLAEATEINATFLGQVECGARGISLDNLFKISDVLEIPTMKFFDYEND